MGTHFKQQNMPLWDTERIIECRNDHLDWMHDHFSYETLVAGEDSELDKGPGQPVERQRARRIRRRPPNTPRPSCPGDRQTTDLSG